MRAKFAIPLGFIGVILVGAGLFSLPVSGGLGFVDALFTATSAICVTGLSVIDPGTELTRFGQIVLMLLVQVGCTGIMTFGTFILVLAGQRISIDQEFSLTNAYGVQGVSGFRGLVMWVVFSMLAFEAAGAFALNCSLQKPFESCFYSVMAFCNAGFSLDASSAGMFRQNPFVLFAMGCLVVVGGLGFMVVYNLCTIKFWRRSLIKQGRLSLHSRIVIWSTAAFVVFSMCLFLALEWRTGLSGLSFLEKLCVSFFQSVNPRTCGFTVIPIEEMHPASRFFSELLMFVGSAPGSAGGGIKITTFVVFLFTVHSYCRNKHEVVISKRTIPARIVRESLIIAFVFLVFIAFATGVLLVTESGRPCYGFENLLFEVVSAVTTTGLSYGATTESLSVAGRFVIMFAMFSGRLGALTMVLTLAGDDEPEMLRYPKEDVLVG